MNYSKSVCCFVHQLVGDDAGVITVRPEGRPGSVPAFLSQSRSAPQAAAGLPVCRGYKQPRAVEWKGILADSCNSNSFKCCIIESLYLTLISEKHQRQKKVPDKFDLIFYGYISKMNQYTKKKYALNKTCQFVAQIMSHFLLFISPNSSVLNTKHKCSI